MVYCYLLQSYAYCLLPPGGKYCLRRLVLALILSKCFSDGMSGNRLCARWSEQSRSQLVKEAQNKIKSEQVNKIWCPKQIWEMKLCAAFCRRTIKASGPSFCNRQINVPTLSGFLMVVEAVFNLLSCKDALYGSLVEINQKFGGKCSFCCASIFRTGANFLPYVTYFSVIHI